MRVKKKPDLNFVEFTSFRLIFAEPTVSNTAAIIIKRECSTVKNLNIFVEMVTEEKCTFGLKKYSPSPINT
jgi:hypothetical protein